MKGEKKPTNPDTEHYEAVLGRVNSLILRYGVIISGALIAIGIIDAFLNPTNVTLPKTTTELIALNIGKPALSLEVLIDGLIHLNGLLIIQMGLLILLATPIIRVAVTTVLFATERDMAYVVIGTFVLVVLLVSVFIVGPIEAGASS